MKIGTRTSALVLLGALGCIVLLTPAAPPRAGAQALVEDAPSLAPPDSTTHGVDFKLECSRCHTPEHWRTLREPLEFAHHEDTGFELRGAHAEVSCRECHASLVFRQIGVMCADCHTDLVHRGELGFDCAQCHNEFDWTQSANLLLEHQQTRFPLLGRHATTDCEACHQTVQKDEFSGMPLDCIQCHHGDYAGTREPDHASLGFSTDCQDCHSVMHLRWADVAFQHPSSFPLVFGHDVRDCGACHRAGQLPPDPQDCYACHIGDYQRVSSPSHIANGFDTDCRVCHDPTGFREPAGYSHAASGFPSMGGHSTVSCRTCHYTPIFEDISRECFACHSEDYYGSQSPNHSEIGFPTECERCHTPAGWTLVSPKVRGGLR